jgi:hypothetical protein
MTDKPISAKIILTLNDKKTTGEEFLALSNTLYRQNLIHYEPRELRQIGKHLELTVTFYDINSFKNWTKNEEVKTYHLEKHKSILLGKPKTVREKDLLIEVDNIKNCTCKKSKFYILRGRSWQHVDELFCSNCFGQVPYSRVPLNIDIEGWQRQHQRIYLNWLESGVLEKAAYKELVNYKKGKLNIEGERIRKELSSFFKIPVYISYFVEQPDINHPCLVCEKKGIKSGLKRPSTICKTCNTIFGDENI